MRTGASDVSSRGFRGQVRQGARLKRTRKTRLRRAFLETEFLEPRTLLATIPAATATGAPMNLSGLSSVTSNGNANSPAVVIDPYDSQKLFAVWGVDLSQEVPAPTPTTAIVEGAYSNDGGATWNPLGEISPPIIDANTIDATPPTPYTQVTEPSVAFDASNHVYVLTSQNTGATDGALVLSKYDFSSSTPDPEFLDNIVYRWLPASDAAYSPTLAVDAAPLNPPAGVPVDPYANNVYVAWASGDIPLANTNVELPFNPHRAELVVSSDGGQTFGGETIANVGPANGNIGPQQDSHPQLVINQNDSGQITIAWDDFGTGSTATPKFDQLLSNLIQAGDSYQSQGGTGIIRGGSTTSTKQGNWAPAAVYPASPNATRPSDPVGIATATQGDGFSTDVNGDGKDDIVVADQGTGQIGVLLNSGTGTFPLANIKAYPTVGSPSGVVLGNFVANHSSTAILDAATSNGAAAGGVNIEQNGTKPNDGQGVFVTGPSLPPVPSGQAETAIGVYDLDGNSLPDIIAADPGNQSIDIWLNPGSPSGPTAPFSLKLPSGDNPIAVVVDKFRGTTSNPDIAVLNSNGTIQFFLNEISPTNPEAFVLGPSYTVAGVVSITSSPVSGNPNLPDLIVVTNNNPGHNELFVLQNQSTAGGVAFSAPQTVSNSSFAGTPVTGQGIAAGQLSTGGNYGSYKDIAVVYAAAGTNESMVAVFQNNDNGTFTRTPPPNQLGDFDAGQTSPTAIALLDLTNSTTLAWNDIVVTNDDNGDPRTPGLEGTVSVLQPAALPSGAVTPGTTPFTARVNVPNQAAVTGLTVSVALTHPTDANIGLVLVAPNGDQITLLQSGALTGANLGVFGESTTNFGVDVGTVFDDNATRNIFDPTAAGMNGNTGPAIGHFRPEGSFTDTIPILDALLPPSEQIANTIDNLVAYELGKFNSILPPPEQRFLDVNGTWTLKISDSAVETTPGNVREFSLEVTTGMTRGTPQTIASGIVVGGSISNSGYPTIAPSTPKGIGPGLVLAEDNTLGPDSPYEGRIYAAYVGYYNVKVGGVTNPTTNTDIFLSYLDPRATSWSAPVQVNDDDAQVDGYSQSNDDVGAGDEVTGRSQYQPEIAVDQATGTVVLDWRDARDDAANARVATYITTSIDGGATFSPQTYANPADTAVDAITGQTEVLGPLPDNQSAGNPQRDSDFGYGNQMGLAVFNGQVYPIWAGNFNQGAYSASTNSIVGNPLNIWYRPMVIAAGPRIVSSSMGPISLAEAMSGTVSISVTFDRPVDPTTFLAPTATQPGDVQVFFHNTTYGDPSVQLTVTGVSPVAGTGSGPDDDYGYTQFTITFNPTPAGASQPYNYTGTYSYLIAPDNGSGLAISSPIESYSGPLVYGGPLVGEVATPRPDDPDDQNADGAVDQNPLTTPFPPPSPPNPTTPSPFNLTPGDVYAVPAPQPVAQVTFSKAAYTGGVNTGGYILSPPFNQNTLPLIVPGPQVLSTSVPGGTGTDNLITNGTTSTLTMTFDRPMLVNTAPAGQTPTPGSFTAADVLQIMGPTGPVSGPWTVTPVSSTETTVNGVLLATEFTIGFPLQQLSGTYTIQIGPNILDQFGDAVDTNQNAGLAVLRDQGQNSPTTTVQYSSTGLPQAIPAPTGSVPGTMASSILVPDNFVVQGDTTTSGISGLRVQINLTYPFDPDLSATLYYDMGQPSQVAVPLFSGVGSGIKTANFTNTVFDDNAATPIQNGSAPFFAIFNPQMPLAAFAGLNAAGTWTLVIQNATTANGGTGATGSLTSWSLSFQKPLPTSGLGEPGSDDINASFHIFTLAQTAALSSEAWTAVGPAAITGGSGQISAIAVDPSDPSGNTVYVTAASGGIWKTTDFLTTNPNGPTYIPLTDFGPSSGIYINRITVFPRNNNTNDSIIIAATGSSTGGKSDGPTPGVGFLISQDGGATWNLYDSSDNVDSNGNLLPIESASRDREFIGMTAYKVVVDPELTPTGQVIIYAAMSGPNGGIWRSEDTGKTWSLMLAGNATDVVLDADSGTVLDPTTGTEVSGNLQIVYAAIEGQGVYISPNQGQVWNLMAGGVGNPLIVDRLNGKNTNVNPLTSPSPNGAEGRIVLAVPQPSGTADEDGIYSGWLYAAVSTPSGGFDGLFLTKDFGQNWTKLGLNTLAPVTANQQAIPTNDITQPAYPITFFSEGNSYLTLIADPTNPNIVYLGSYGGDNILSDTGLIRIDATNVWDAHSLVAYNNFAADGGLLQQNTTAGPAPIDGIQYGAPSWLNASSPAAEEASYLDFIRNPEAPFLANATLQVSNYNSFTNNGAGVTWMPFDMPGTGDISGTGYQAAVALTDPTTGLPRLIFGNSQGVWSVLVNNGVMEPSVGGTDALPATNRNGNLQITQFYDGALQPSNAAAQIAGALFYGAAQDNGGPFSDPNILTDGNLQWSVPAGDISEDLDSTAVAVDQQGNGTVDQYWFPGTPQDSTSYTDFFQVNGTGRTFGLLQAAGGWPTPDPTNWPTGGVANFAVDPVNGSDMTISSHTGAVFATLNGGETWFEIGGPTVFGSPGDNSLALAYGAPDPAAPEGV
ncbi:MAG: VCBS repeat-containing protein, partial [Isosphaeraceae bacterium]